jgi:HPt (histidine-containing phosphotransfer) domain-containing protein
MEARQNGWLKELTSLLNVESLPAPPRTSTIANSGSDEPIVDFKTLERLKVVIGSGSTGLIAELVDILQREAQRLLPLMLEAARSANAAELEYAAHTFKGSGRNLGLSRLVLLSRKLELRCRAGDLSGTEHLVVQVAEAYQEALPVLKNMLDDLPV